MAGVRPENITTRSETELREGGGGGGPVPEANRPGHHPEHEQDKPDPDAFVERFRTVPAGPSSGTADEIGSPAHHAKRLVAIGVGLVGAVAVAVVRKVRGRS